MNLFGIVIGLFIVLLLVFLAVLVSKIGRHYRLSAEPQRKLVHVSVGISAMFLPLFLNRLSFCFFAVFSLIALVLLRLPIFRKSAGSSVHSIKRTSWGDIYFLVSISVLFLMKPGDPLLYILPLAVVTISDASAALIGIEYGRHKFGSKDREKSFEGTAVFFFVTWIVAVIILDMTPTVERNTIIPLATVIASFSALVEASSWRGLDNLFVPLSIYALLVFNPSDPFIQIALAGGFIAALILSSASAPFLKLSRHTSCALAICLFLTIGVAGLYHAIFPLTAFVVVLSLRYGRTQNDVIYLEFIVVMTLIGILWLSVGNLAGRTAIEFYTVSFAGLTAGYLSLHFVCKYQFGRLVGSLATGIITWLFFQYVTSFESVNINWLPRSSSALFSALIILSAVLVAQLPKRQLNHAQYKMAATVAVVSVICFCFGITSAEKPKTDNAYLTLSVMREVRCS